MMHMGGFITVFCNFVFLYELFPNKSLKVLFITMKQDLYRTHNCLPLAIVIVKVCAEMGLINLNLGVTMLC